jgi:hypothetical protein
MFGLRTVLLSAYKHYETMNDSLVVRQPGKRGKCEVGATSLLMKEVDKLFGVDKILRIKVLSSDTNVELVAGTYRASHYTVIKTVSKIE